MPNRLDLSAGEIPAPDDQREIDAALKAGRLSYRVYPYFLWRYGARGEQYTRCDSSWLAWLTRHDRKHVEEQVHWLWRVLSNRGMPGLILELHLRILQRQLVRNIPDARSKYASLSYAADSIGTEYSSIFSERERTQLVQQFLTAIGNESSSRLVRGCGELLVAAAIDQRLGIPNAVASFQEWILDLPSLNNLGDLRRALTSAERRQLKSPEFADRWTQAVKSTATAALGQQNQNAV